MEVIGLCTDAADISKIYSWGENHAVMDSPSGLLFKLEYTQDLKWHNGKESTH